MKVTWKKKSKKRSFAALSERPFEVETEEEEEEEVKQQDNLKALTQQHHLKASTFADQGTNLAENGKYREALGKWEAALSLMPENAVVHEQKAQVLLEIGDAWEALKSATRAADLEPTWAEAWVTLGRAQLNYGEPDSAIKSFDKALAIKPDSEEARDDKLTAVQLVKRREQLQSSGLSDAKNRYVVGDKAKSS